MKINFDRLSQLAGIPSSSKKSLNEGAHYEGMGHYDEGMGHYDEGMGHYNEGEEDDKDKNEAYYEASAIDGLEEMLDEEPLEELVNEGSGLKPNEQEDGLTFVKKYERLKKAADSGTGKISPIKAKKEEAKKALGKTRGNVIITGNKDGTKYFAYEEASSISELNNLDEIIEVDEVMLVQELRRMKKLMEAKKRSQLLEARKLEQRKQALIEQRLKEVIDDEVKDILNKLNYNSGWIYGDNKPKNSRHGYSHQGSFLKGLGFK